MFLNVGPRDDFYPMPSVNPCGMERSIGRPENNGNGAHGGARDGLVCEEGGSAVANWFSFPKQR